MRDIFEKKRFTYKVTQGTIINNCIAEDYKNSKVYGCIITPRCDLAHKGKVSTVHYLPIISLEDWIKNVAYKDLKASWIKSIENQLIKTLNDSGINSDILNQGLNKDDIIKVAQNIIKNNKQIITLQSNLEKYLNQSDRDFKTELKNKKLKGQLKCIIQDLIKGNNHSFYLIEDWEKDKEKLPYKVIILRDIRRINIDIVLRLEKGFYESDFRKEEIAYNDLAVTENSDNIFCAVAQIKSPYIEHILQAFSYNFCRIGVEDFNIDELVILFQTEFPKILLS